MACPENLEFSRKMMTMGRQMAADNAVALGLGTNSVGTNPTLEAWVPGRAKSFFL